MRGKVMMRVSLFISLIFGALSASAISQTPSRTLKTRNDNSKFVTTTNGEFQLDGKEFKFLGTNAYWLPVLNSDEDIVNTLSNITAAGIRVVRIWAFNDVESPTEGGVWFQSISNGVATINTGPNGLARLDKVIELAEKAGVFILPSLTNNWYPTTSSATRRWASDPRPRNFLSNSYGGMDAYVKAFGASDHDEFYTNEKILAAFMNYTTQIISRYVNSPAIFGWELANDPRCYSTLSASSSCNPQTITRWHATIAQHVKSVDPNHLVSSGNQGFFCADCPKLFPLSTPAPQPSPAPGARRRNTKPLSKSRLFLERSEARRLARQAKRRSGQLGAVANNIRGRWAATAAKRQSSSSSSAFDGSQGVDSEDILNIPEIGFGTAQLFPDQDQYSIDGSSSSGYDNVVSTGISWIQRQAEIAQTYGKPVFLTGFGLVSQTNAPYFVPFNSTTPVGSQVQSHFVTDVQRDDAYVQWLNAGYSSGLNGLIQYQWAQGNLTAKAGTAITNPSSSAKFKLTRRQVANPDYNYSPMSPNDGYSDETSPYALDIGASYWPNLLATFNSIFNSVF